MPKKPRSAASSHVLLSLPPRGEGNVTIHAGDPPAELPDAWWALRPPPALPDGDLVFVDQPSKGAASILAAKSPPAVLPLGDYLAQIVVEAKLGKKLAKLAGVTARQAELRGPKGKVAKGYALLEVTRLVPLDRRASKATWKNGWLETLEHAAWRDGAPLPPLFRVLDRPALLAARRDLAEALAAAAKGKVALDVVAESGGELFPPPWSLAEIGAVDTRPAAEEAFWAALAGGRAARKAALGDPWWAYAVAATIDQAGKADSRAAACASPIVAVLYAANVDRRAKDATRAAAAKHGLAALHYATQLDLRLDPALRPLLLRDAGHDETTLPRTEEQIDELARWSRGEPLPPRPLVARREWPPHDLPRYATADPSVKKAKHAIVEAEVRRDIDDFVARGYERVGLEGSPRPEEVVDAVHRAIDAIQRGEPKLDARQRFTRQMELGSAWGEQLHRALGWQWASLDGEVALVSRDRAHVHFPFAFVGGLLARGARENSLALLFNMLAEGSVPPGKSASYTRVS